MTVLTGLNRGVLLSLVWLSGLFLFQEPFCQDSSLKHSSGNTAVAVVESSWLVVQAG